MTSQRTGIPSWDETFMSIAEIAAKRSKDPSTQVGACIVSNDNRILSVGYNGAPNGFDDELFPWAKEADSIMDTKYPYVVHAERNAILNFRGILREFSGAKIYTTHFPCNECSKEIVQSGIKEVIHLNEHSMRGDLNAASLRIFDIVGVTSRLLSSPIV